MKRIFSHIGFSAALTLFALNVMKVEYVTAVLIGLAVLFIASLFLKKYRNALAVPLCLGSAVFACLLFITVYNSAVLPALSLDGKSALCEFYITDLAKSTDSAWLYTVKTNSISSSGAPQVIRLNLISKDVIRADAYQLIRANLTFEKTGNTAFTSYGNWSRGIYLSAKLNGYTVSDVTFNEPLCKLLHLRHDIIQTLMSYVSGDEGAFAGAVLIGNKSNLSQDVINTFAFAGASHLMAVSGLHLSVIISVLHYLLDNAGVKPKYSAAVSLFAIAVYIFLAGSTGSVRRAGIMMLVLLSGELSGRKADNLNSLGFATFIICLNPFAPADVGTVLSVLSALSLITVFPKLMPKREIHALQYFMKSLAASVGVTAYTLPAMYLFFGYASFNSVISNIVMIPLGSASTVMSLVTYICCTLGVFPHQIATLDRMFNRFVISVCRYISQINSLSFTMNKYFGVIIAGALIIFAYCFISHNKKLLKTAGVISSVIVLVSIISFSALSESSLEIYVSKGNALALCSKEGVIVYNVDEKADYYGINNYLKSKHKPVSIIIDTKGGGAYTAKLCEGHNVNKVISASYSDYLEYLSCNEVLVTKSYKNRISDNFTIEYSNAKDYNCFNAEYNNVRISTNASDGNAEILISNKKAHDKYGTIDLSKGGVIYRIDSENYEARRMSLWQE